MKHDLSWMATRSSAEAFLRDKAPAGLDIAGVRKQLDAVLRFTPEWYGDRTVAPFAAAAEKLLEMPPTLLERAAPLVNERALLFSVLRRLSECGEVEKQGRDHARHMRDESFRFAYSLASVLRSNGLPALSARLVLAAAIAWGVQSPRKSASTQGQVLKRWDERVKRSRAYLRSVVASAEGGAQMRESASSST